MHTSPALAPVAPRVDRPESNGSRHVSLWMALGVLALAGCLDGAAEDAAADTGGGGLAVVDMRFAGQPLPFGCDADRTAVAHGPGGKAVSWTGATGLGCFVGTTWGTAEPSLGVTSQGTLFVYPAFEVPLGGPAEAGQFTGMGVARLAAGEDAFTRPVSEVAGAANFHPYTADPFLYVEPYTDRVFMEDLLIPPFNCANLSYSDDDGATWSQTLGGCLVWDHVGWGSGPATVSSPSYPVVIQRCAITYVATTLASQATGCQKSLDGGATWELPGEPAFFGGPDGLPYVPSTCHGAAHHVTVDHRGWTWIGRDWCQSGPWVALSKDEGATWTQHHVHPDPLAWHDVAVGVDAAGTAYAFWISNDNRPLLAVSHDDGATWSTPWDIAPPGLVAAGMSNIAAGGAGKAGFTYAATFDGLTGVHAVLAAGYGLDGADPVFLSSLATPEAAPINAGSCSGGLCDGQADFLDATLGPDGTVWGSYSHNGNAAAGRLWGAPSLWDDTDPDGPYNGSGVAS